MNTLFTGCQNPVLEQQRGEQADIP